MAERKKAPEQQPPPGSGVDPIRDVQFDEVIRKEELAIIQQRRENLPAAPKEAAPAPAPGKPARPRPGDLVGLALSGGGIRSATFNLGVLQRLAELNILPLVDYLSTVSGGGFIGGWWSSWMTRREDRPQIRPANAGKWFPGPRRTQPFDEALEVEHLRLYSNYLIPRKGLFSPDTWRAITVVLRNLIVTQVVVASFLAALFLLVDWIYVRLMPDSGMLNLETTGAPAGLRFLAIWQWPLVGVAVVWFLFTVAFLCVASGESAGRQRWRTWITAAHARFAGTVAVLGGLFALAGFSDRLVLWLNQAISEAILRKVTENGGWLAVLPGLAAAIYTALQKAPAGGGDSGRQKDSGFGGFVLKIAPFLSLLTLAILLGAGAWRLLRETRHFLKTAPQEPDWVFITALIVVFGVSQLYFFRSLMAQRLRWRDFRKRDPQDIGLLVIMVVSISCGVLLYSTYELRFSQSWICLACLLVVTQIAIGAGFATDPNALSLHSFYKSRLVRAYLGASNAERLNDLAQNLDNVTRPKAYDDQPLCDNKAWVHGGPIHILNTTLNLVGASDLTAEQRQAEVFELSPLFCGSARTGYRRTEDYADGRLTLGTAVAISGAAASPGMGPGTTVPLAMLLAFFNVRLGYWIANPQAKAWRYPWTRFWLWYMLREMLAQTTSQGRFSFLSDGGHLENLGLYALVKRRCRYIIVCDASADPGCTFDDLANALRMIRIDFGCEVKDFDVTHLRLIPGEGHPFRRSNMHFAVGTITYPDPGTPPSTLVYLKNSLTGDEPADIQGYAHNNSAFPHQTTADQFFDEAQFESYRRLGQHVADAAF